MSGGRLLAIVCAHSLNLGSSCFFLQAPPFPSRYCRVVTVGHTRHQKRFRMRPRTSLTRAACLTDDRLLVPNTRSWGSSTCQPCEGLEGAAERGSLCTLCLLRPVLGKCRCAHVTLPSLGTSAAGTFVLIRDKERLECQKRRGWLQVGGRRLVCIVLLTSVFLICESIVCTQEPCRFSLTSGKSGISNRNHGATSASAVQLRRRLSW